MSFTAAAAAARGGSYASGSAGGSAAAAPTPLLNGHAPVPPSPSDRAAAAEAEVGRLRGLLASQAAALDRAERAAHAARDALRGRDADCAALGALLAAVHRGELGAGQARGCGDGIPFPFFFWVGGGD